MTPSNPYHVAQTKPLNMLIYGTANLKELKKQMKVIVLYIITYLMAQTTFARGHVSELDLISKRRKVVINRELGLKCTEPEDLHPAARQLIKEYTESNILNSTFFSDFIWLHPEYEEFLSCIICAVERPNDAVWETEFDTVCPDENSIYSTYIQEKTES